MSASPQYADLMRDCARLADEPLEGYRTFIDEFVVRVGEMAELLRYAAPRRGDDIRFVKCSRMLADLAGAWPR